MPDSAVTKSKPPAALKYRPLVVVVAGALVDSDNRVLLSQRMDGEYRGRWNFPGGKVERGETPEAALVRELKEELDVVIQARDLIPLTFISYPYPRHHMLLPLYICRKWRGTPNGIEGDPLQWATAAELETIDLLPGNQILLDAVKKILQT